VTIVRGILSGSAALFLAFTLSSLLGIVSTFKGIAQSKAIGIAVVPGGMVEAASSPVFWILAALSCAFFFWASGQGTRAVRILLFWLPIFLICVLGLGIAALFTYAFLQSRKG
jgi:hypothetical protein